VISVFLKNKKYKAHITYEFDVNTLKVFGVDFEDEGSFHDYMVDVVAEKIKAAVNSSDPEAIMGLIKTDEIV
jgi:hypothetical protein